MKIVVHDFGGYQFSAQLARTLADRAHIVTYLYAAGIKVPRARVNPDDGKRDTVTFRGITIEDEYRRGAGIHRLAQERRYGSILGKEITRADPDVVISANCPLDAQAMAQVATHKVGAAFVHWCQDVYSLAVSRLLARRFPLAGRVIGARFARLERRVLQSSDAVVLIAEDFLPLMRRWRVAEERTAVIENWAPLDDIRPLLKANPWAVSHGVATVPAFVYAGTLGRKHDATFLLRLAHAVPDAQVVVVSEGAGTDRLRATAPVPDNLKLLPLQSSADLAEVLASADVLVALLEEDAREFSVPSKVLTYLTAGRPILAAIPNTNLAARTIADAGAGIVVDPSDHDGFIAAARTLLADPDARSAAGQAARSYAERTFDIRAKADRFEAVLRAATQRAHSNGLERHDTGRAARRP